MNKPRKKIIIQCDLCGTDTPKIDSTVYAARKHNRLMFCSTNCRVSYFSTQINCNCRNCDKPFTRSSASIKNSINVFCSRSCVAHYNNSVYPNRGAAPVPETSVIVRTPSKHNTSKIRCQRKYLCTSCATLVSADGITCGTCKKNKRQELTLGYTVGQIRELYKDKSSMATAAKIRGYGITIYKNSDKPKHCIRCKYDKFYEVCHIKPVSSFDNAATMADVHAIDNLIALCPNCHWEFDHAMLLLKDILLV